MEWFRKLHPAERTDRAVETMLKRTGIGDQIQKELDDERRERFEQLRQRKAASVDRYMKAVGPLKRIVDETEDVEKKARETARQALQENIRAREALTTAHDSHQSEATQLDRELLECYDPAIDAFLDELQQLHFAAPQLLREWPDPAGTLKRADGARMSSNKDAVDARVKAIVHLKLDVVPTLRTAHHVTDLAAEIRRLRDSIPEA